MEERVWVVVENDRGCGAYPLGVFPDEQSAYRFILGRCDCHVFETTFYREG